MASKFIKDIFSTLVTQILVFLFGLFVSIVLARQLGPEGKGIYSLVVLLPAFLIYFASFSMGQAAIYYLGQSKYALNVVYGSTVMIGGLVSLLCFFLGGIALLFHSSFFPAVPIHYLLMSLFLAPCQIYFGFFGYLLLGIQEIKKYNLFSLLQLGLFFLVIMALVFVNYISIANLIYGEIAAYVLSTFIIAVAIKKKIGGLKPEFSKSYAADAFFYGAKIYFGNIFSFVNYRFSIFLVNFMLNPLNVGLWSVAIAISEKLWVFSDAVGTVLLPKVASVSDDNYLKKFIPLVFRSIILINFFVAAVLFLAGGFIINLLYSTQFSGSVPPFRILLVGAFFWAGFKVFESNFKGTGRPGLVTGAIIASALVNIILSLIFIPKYGIIGAAWSSTISYMVAFIITLFFYVKNSGIPLVQIFLIGREDIAIYRNLYLSAVAKISNFKKKDNADKVS